MPARAWMPGGYSGRAMTPVLVPALARMPVMMRRRRLANPVDARARRPDAGGAAE